MPQTKTFFYVIFSDQVELKLWIMYDKYGIDKKKFTIGTFLLRLFFRLH